MKFQTIFFWEKYKEKLFSEKKYEKLSSAEFFTLSAKR